MDISEKLIDREPTIIKRDGSTVVYKPKKMLKFLEWACQNGGHPQTLLENIILPSNRAIPVDELLSLVSMTAEDLSSRISPQWLYPSGRIMMLRNMKMLKNQGFCFDPDNPDKAALGEILKFSVFGLREFLETNPDQQDAWETFINSVDFNLDYDKPISYVVLYDLKQARTVEVGNGVEIKELPQLTLMRQGLASAEYKKGVFDLSHALSMYLSLRKGDFTLATPMAVHGGKEFRASGSCTLLTVGDSKESIGQFFHDIGVHSAIGSGNGIDISQIRCSGAPISKSEGTSNGVVNLLKTTEAILSLFNQGGKRIGSGVVSFPWFYRDVMQILPLKSNTGSAEQRVRGLKYSMMMDGVFLDKCVKDEDIVVFCPHELYHFLGDNQLNNTYGEDFKQLYSYLEQSFYAGKVDGTSIKARTVMRTFLKYRYEHGNLYCTFTDNINNQGMLNLFVRAANLCTEVLIPSRRD